MSSPREGTKSYPKLLDWASLLLCRHAVHVWRKQAGTFAVQYVIRTRSADNRFLNGYQLTWIYYGYSRTYACILGLTQVVGAALLLFRKTTLLATLIMLPVMVNILLINIFILLFWTTQNPEPAGSRRTHMWIRVFIVLTAGVITAQRAVVGRCGGDVHPDFGPKWKTNSDEERENRK